MKLFLEILCAICVGISFIVGCGVILCAVVLHNTPDWKDDNKA